MSRVERISENPLKAAQEEEERLVYEELVNMQIDGIDEWPTGMTATQVSSFSMEGNDHNKKDKEKNVM